MHGKETTLYNYHNTYIIQKQSMHTNTHIDLHMHARSRNRNSSECVHPLITMCTLSHLSP